MNENGKKRGRPYIENPKKITLTLRVSKDEKKRIDRTAKDSNMSISDLLRIWLNSLPTPK